MLERNVHVKKILLVEDDSDDRELFQDALNAIEKDITLVTAENGIQGLHLLRSSELPDLIFLDLNMPIKNGYECLEEIKQDEELKHVPVIIFSTSLQLESAYKVYDTGASLYIVKPNNYQDWKKSLKRAIDITFRFPSKLSKESFILKL